MAAWEKHGTQPTTGAYQKFSTVNNLLSDTAVFTSRSQCIYESGLAFPASKMLCIVLKHIAVREELVMQ